MVAYGGGQQKMSRDEHVRKGGQLWKAKAVMENSGNNSFDNGNSGHDELNPSQSQTNISIADSGMRLKADVERLAVNIEKSELLQKKQLSRKTRMPRVTC